MKKLAIVTTHPIQYNAPLFKLLHQRNQISIKVFYTRGRSDTANYDVGFQKQIEWDIPLLDGYDYHFTRNTSKNPSSKKYRGIVTPDLITEIINYEADAILVYGWNFHSHFQLMKYFKGKLPIMFRGDSTLLDQTKGLKSWMRSLFLKYIYKYIDIALYTGINNKNYFRKHGMSENKLIFAPHAIDNERFESVSLKIIANRNTYRSEIGIPQNAIVFLFAGKFESKKNPILLMQAFIEMNRPNTALLMVGDGHLSAEIHRLASNHSQIYVLPFQNQSHMPRLYTIADVYILPSKGPSETWGLAVNEAMACGLPIIVSNKVGCAPDLVKIGTNGYVFNSGDILELTNCMKKFENKETIAGMGNHSKDWIKSFNFERICAAIEGYLLKS